MKVVVPARCVARYVPTVRAVPSRLAVFASTVSSARTAHAIEQRARTLIARLPVAESVNDGRGVGATVGTGVGCAVGTAVGATVGTGVGSGPGGSGVAVGVGVGVGVGSTAGAKLYTPNSLRS